MQQSLSLARRALAHRSTVVVTQNSRNICLINSARSTIAVQPKQQQQQLFHSNVFLRSTLPPQQAQPQESQLNTSQQQVQEQKLASEGKQQEQQNDQQEQTNTNTAQGKQSLKEKLKEFIKKYGITGVIVYFGIYYITWASFYFALEHKWFNAGDVMNLAKKFGMEKYMDIESDKNKKVANIGLAWFITKFTEPLRFGLTIMVTPSVLKLTKKILRRG